MPNATFSMGALSFSNVYSIEDDQNALSDIAWLNSPYLTADPNSNSPSTSLLFTLFTSVGNGAFNRVKDVQFARNVRKISIGSWSFKQLDHLAIDDLPFLSAISVGRNSMCYVMEADTRLGGNWKSAEETSTIPRRPLSITNCPKLESVAIGSMSFWGFNSLVVKRRLDEGVSRRLRPAEECGGGGRSDGSLFPLGDIGWVATCVSQVDCASLQSLLVGPESFMSFGTIRLESGRGGGSSS